MRNVYIGDGDSIRIGNNCRINERVRLCNVEIGDNVLIAREHVFIGAQHNYHRTDIPIVDQGVNRSQPTIIENDVWIALKAMIMPGLRIRKGGIIGAGAIVTKDTEEYGIYGGNPAKLIKIRVAKS